MNWKTAMYLDLWNALSPRRSEHDRTVRTLQDLIVSDPARADLYRGCLAKLEEGYDL